MCFVSLKLHGKAVSAHPFSFLLPLFVLCSLRVPFTVDVFFPSPFSFYSLFLSLLVTLSLPHLPHTGSKAPTRLMQCGGRIHRARFLPSYALVELLGRIYNHRHRLFLQLHFLVLHNVLQRALSTLDRLFHRFPAFHVGEKDA